METINNKNLKHLKMYEDIKPSEDTNGKPRKVKDYNEFSVSINNSKEKKKKDVEEQEEHAKQQEIIKSSGGNA